jgi:WD40 repeat protein
MTATAPRPPSADPATLDALEALIEEARRRARRRRLAYAAMTLLTVGTGLGAYFGFRGGHGAGESSPAAVGLPAVQAGLHPVVPARHNGPLTLMDLPTDGNGEGPAGWYGLSTLDAKGRLHPLVRCPHRVDWCGESVSADWSPDGSRLAFSVTSYANPNPYNGLHIVTLATDIFPRGDDRQIYSCPSCQWRQLDWSPDGTRLAFVWGPRIYLINADGSGHTVLKTRTRLPASSPSWSRDGKWIAFASGPRRDRSVYVMGIDGSAPRLVAAHGSAPAWSPLGKTIAYQDACGIKFVTPAGKDVTPPSPFKCNAIGIQGQPVWSPDGRKIAILGKTTWGTGKIVRGTWVMNTDGSNLRRVTSKSIGVWVGEAPRATWRPIP